MPIARANIWRSAASPCPASRRAAIAAGARLASAFRFAGALLLTAPLAAQTTTGAAPTREEIDRAAPPAQATAPARLTVEDETANAPCPLAAPHAPSVALTLREVRFEHLQGLPADRLHPAYEAYLGKNVAGGDLCAIRDAAAAILRQAGYIAAVQIPAQDGAGGVVRFDVVMARLVRIEFADRRPRASRRLAAYLAKLRAEPVFNIHAAERYLLLARDLPGYDVHLTLRSAEGEPGEVVGIVAITRTRLMITADFQNYGSRELGRWGALLSAQINDVAGSGDRLTLGLFNSLRTHEQTVVQAGYDLRLGGEGAAVGARFTYASTHPAIDGDPLASRTLVAAAEASYPLLRRETATVRVAGGFEAIDQDLRQAGILATRDRLRVGFLRVDAEAHGHARGGLVTPNEPVPLWRVAGTLELRRGFGILGATKRCGGFPLFPDCTTLPTPSRLQADPEATLVRFTGYGEVRPLRHVAIVATPRLQYAFAPLASYEQYSGGDYTIGRGYDPGAAIGDSGAGLAIEARYGSIAPRARGIAFQPFLFVDGTWVWNRATLVPEDDPLRLLSAGGGIRAALTDRARIDLTAATPLRRGPYQTSRGGARVLLSITTRLAR